MADAPAGGRRCYLVHALAPPEVAARAANDRLNEYVEDARRGICAFHDHFTRRPHGGVVVLDVETSEQHALLDDHGPLEGWDVRVHALTFALSAVGFFAQATFTLEAYRHTTLDELRAAEEPDPRFWWRDDAEG